MKVAGGDIGSAAEQVAGGEVGNAVELAVGGDLWGVGGVDGDGFWWAPKVSRSLEKIMTKKGKM
jgi:hypothetical protein